jgi:hypothetical protein
MPTTTSFDPKRAVWLVGRLLVERLDMQTFEMVVKILNAFEKAEKECFAPPCEDGMT